MEKFYIMRFFPITTTSSPNKKGENAAIIRLKIA